MAGRGPVPKRSSERLARRAKRDEPDKVRLPGSVLVPPPADDWHEVARDWYLSLAESGGARYYEPSDWAAARLVAVEMTRMLAVDEPTPAAFRQVWLAMADLLTTESARRRARIEVERRGSGAPADSQLSGVVKLDDYRELYG